MFSIVLIGRSMLLYVISILFSVRFKSDIVFKDPTESIIVKSCSTVRSADDELKKQFTFRIDSPEGV